MAGRLDRAAHFTGIWERADWGRPKSSAWARLEQTGAVRAWLPGMLERYRIRSMFDAPCGDLTWMGTVELPSGVRYIGGDIVAPLIAELKAAHPGREFRVHDLLADAFPAADLWLCRDCLTLYSFADQAQAFRRFLESPIRFVALTCHDDEVNIDLASGPERAVNYLADPFGFPEPDERLVDGVREPDRPGLKPRALCLWRREAVEPAMRRFVQQTMR